VHIAASLYIEKAKRQGYYFRSKDKSLSSRYNPVREGERILKDVVLKQNKIVVFLGSMPLYHVFKALKNNCRIIVFEKDNRIKKYIHKIISFFLQKKEISEQAAAVLSQSVYDTAADLDQIFTAYNITLPNLKNIAFIFSNTASALEYKKIKTDIINKLHQDLAGYTTESCFRHIWRINALRNLFFIKKIRLFSAVSPVPPVKTALLLASGISLNNNLARLRYLAQQFTVFCLPGAYNFLQQNKIKVDFIIATDPGFNNYYHFMQFDYKKKLPAFLLSLSVNTQIAALTAFQTYFFFELAELYNICSCVADNYIEMSGSAVNTGLQLLAEMGYLNIITGGIDFLFTPWALHAPGNAIEEILFTRNQRLKPFSSAYQNLMGYDFKKKKSTGFYFDKKFDIYYKIFDNIRKKKALQIYNYEDYEIEESKKDAPSSRVAINKNKVINKDERETLINCILNKNRLNEKDINKNSGNQTALRESYLKSRYLKIKEPNYETTPDL